MTYLPYQSEPLFKTSSFECRVYGSFPFFLKKKQRKEVVICNNNNNNNNNYQVPTWSIFLIVSRRILTDQYTKWKHGFNDYVLQLISLKIIWSSGVATVIDKLQNYPSFTLMCSQASQLGSPYNCAYTFPKFSS